MKKPAILLLFLIISFISLIFDLKSIKASEMKYNKTVLILHGWPQPIEKGSMYYEYFENKKYNVISPRLFTKDFVLTENEAKKYIEQQLAGKKPDAIIGISMGGLLVPEIAKAYPNAKLVFIASGPKIQSDASGFNAVLYLAKNKNVLRLLNLFKFMPQRVLFEFYELINPFKGTADDRKIYVEDMKKNFKYIISIPVDEEEEIINFVTTTDNTNLLKTLKNKSLIFSGKNDLMMPINPEINLHNLLINSQLIVNDGGHYNVITDVSFKDLDKFLAQ